jgi:hypothetical protein
MLVTKRERRSCSPASVSQAGEGEVYLLTLKYRGSGGGWSLRVGIR